LNGENLGAIKQKITKDYWDTQKASWKVWPIAQLVNFALIPGSMRILFINWVGFFWGIFMQLRISAKKNA